MSRPPGTLRVVIKDVQNIYEHKENLNKPMEYEVVVMVASSWVHTSF